MAGMKSHEVTIGIYNCLTGKTIFLETGEPKEQYLTNIAWDPTDKFIYVAVLNREQNHMWFNQYDAATGKFVKTLFEEMHPKYVEPLHPALFLNVTKDQFIWQSQRDGYNHLYLYSSEGRMLKQITKGEWIVTGIHGIDSKDEYLYFESTKESPVERHIYRVSLKTGEIVQLTTGKGVHSAAFNSGFTHFFETYSSHTIPNINRIVNTSGKTVKTIVEAKYPFEGYEVPKTHLIEITAADGKTKLYGRYTEPIRKDSSQKCPAIIYVYGGPHAQMVTDSWLMGGSLWEYYMAQKGYAVVCVDNRGSSDRGLEFENVIFRQCGVAEAEDQMKVVEFLKSKPYVDPARIGVHGWSYGGLMTTTLMTRYADTFKAGVAGGPVTDWKFYEVMYGERYMDTPEENPDGYAKTSLLDKGKLLKGKLLIVHGYQDETVVPQHSLSFIENCIKSKVQVDFFLYPSHEHNVRGMDRVHLMQKVTEYFEIHLK
jgi:dipeptidyl-peptidase-4